MPGGSRLDHVYRSILMTKFFTKGWGKPENLKRLFAFKEKVTNREVCYRLVPKNYPVTITKEDKYSDCTVLEGHFLSPFATYLPGIVPKESETAHFQVVLPPKWNSDHYRPICLHLGGTGDHGFWRRRQMMAKPLLKEGGIASVILENPFYGVRKPKDQVRSSLHNVSDIIVMGGCLILESLVIFHWCENNGLGPLGVTGMSMGGHMASLAATNWPKPLVLVPCLSWSSATPVFTQGVMSYSINWELLGSQYFADDVFREEMKKFIHVDKTVPISQDLPVVWSPEHSLPMTVNTENLAVSQDAFRAGQQFAKHFPQAMEHIRLLSREDKNTKPLVSAGVANQETNNRIKQQALRQSSTDAIGSNVAITSSVENSNSANYNNQMVGSNTILSSESRLLNNVPDPQGIKESVPETEKKAEENASGTFSSLLGKRKSTEGSLLAQFTESKTRILGFRSRQSEESSKTDSQTIEQVKNSIRESVSRWREDEALLFMHGIMDECTHLRNFTVPVDTSLIIAICAKDDAYVPREGCADLTDIWPGTEVRFLDAGHVSAYLLHKHTFRAAIIESFQRLKKKYIDV